MSSKIIFGEQEYDTEGVFLRAARASTGFQHLGVKADDKVAIILRNCVEYFEASIASTMANAYPVPINWHFTSDEVNYILSDSGAKIVIVHADLLSNIRAGIPEGTIVIVVPTSPNIVAEYKIKEGHAIDDDSIQWNEWLQDFDANKNETSLARGSMIYTSGTTGKPKGVLRPPKNEYHLSRLGITIKEAWGIESGEDVSAVVTGPLYHTAPNGYATVLIHLKANLIIQPKFDAENLLQLIEQHRITHLHMVPIMYVRLLKLPQNVRNRYDISSLKFVAHTGAPCPINVKQEMINWWGPIIWEYYGSTEGSVMAVIGGKDALEHLGSVGKPCSGVDIKILDENHNEVANNTLGEIFLRNKNVPDFSYNGENKSSAADKDGFFTVGDLGRMKDGYLYIADRSTDMILSGGVNIYTAEIEGCLIGFDEIEDCAVFGIPNKEFGQAVCACIKLIPEEKLTAIDIRKEMSMTLASYKLPREVYFLPEMQREDSGKLFKRKLQNMRDQRLLGKAH